MLVQILFWILVSLFVIDLGLVIIVLVKHRKNLYGLVQTIKCLFGIGGLKDDPCEIALEDHWDSLEELFNEYDEEDYNESVEDYPYDELGPYEEVPEDVLEKNSHNPKPKKKRLEDRDDLFPREEDFEDTEEA